MLDDLVIADLSDDTGLEREWLCSRAGRPLKMIALVDDLSNESVAAAERVGSDTTLCKPIRRDELIRVAHLLVDSRC